MEQAPGPVKLLGDDNAHQWMRQGQTRQRPELLSALTTDGVQSIRAADEQTQIAALLQPARESFRQLNRIPFLTSLIQRNDPGMRRRCRQQSFALGAHQTGDIRIPTAFTGGNFHQIQCAFSRQASGIFRVTGFDPAGHANAYSEQVDFHV